MLTVDSLCVSYKTKLILKNISFTIKPGEVLGVIGPNGVGKSTLVRALSGVIPIQGGHILIDGEDITSMQPAQKSNLIAVVPQASQLPQEFTAWQLVLLGRTPHLNWWGSLSEQDIEITHQAMERTNTLDLADRKIGEISGGEQQRIMLARALAQSTPVLMLDEPTAHLDLQYQISLLSQVHELALQDHLCVLITMHDLNLVARYTDRVALLVNEELRAIGTPEKILTSDLLSEAYQIEVQVFHDTQFNLPVILPK